jgi:hypothetical protein
MLAQHAVLVVSAFVPPHFIFQLVCVCVCVYVLCVYMLLGVCVHVYMCVRVCVCPLALGPRACSAASGPRAFFCFLPLSLSAVYACSRLPQLVRH